MRYRPLGPGDDYTVSQAFLVNSPECVAQAIKTRLKLWQGEWFVDTTDGTPYATEVLGVRNSKDPNAAIKQRILGTPGVTAMTAYSSSYDGNTRQLTVTATVDTAYGQVSLSEVL